MVIRALLTTGLLTAVVSAPAFAQTYTNSTIRETVSTQSQPIVANSKEDLALQEEIRRIRAYNAQVDRRVGISGSETISASTSFAAPYVAPVSNTYAGGKIELFEQAATSPTMMPAQPATIYERQPVAGTTSIYRVVEGDTLYNLSKRNCIDVVSIQNQNQLSDSNIRLGQVLTIPASQCQAAAKVESAGTVRIPVPAPTAQTINAGVTNSSYAVLPKDSFYSIGRRYCVTASEVASANSLSTASIIKPGQILNLPANACQK